MPNNEPNPFTRLAEIWDVSYIDYDELSIYNGLSVVELADALEERFTDEADMLGMTEHGFLSDLLSRALGHVDWRDLARSMFDELAEEAPAFRFESQYCPPEKMLPDDTTHQNPREWAKENGYTVRGDYMSDADQNMFFFVLEFPED